MDTDFSGSWTSVGTEARSILVDVEGNVFITVVPKAHAADVTAAALSGRVRWMSDGALCAALEDAITDVKEARSELADWLAVLRVLVDESERRMEDR